MFLEKNFRIENENSPLNLLFQHILNGYSGKQQGFVQGEALI